MTRRSCPESVVLGIILFAQLFVLADDVPVANIPHAAAAVDVDGVIRQDEWSRAAILHDIRPLGSAWAGDVSTTFRVRHDGETIYVAVECAGVPESSPRSWPDEFFRNDDSVEVVLGMADPELRDRGSINVGGYAGALDGVVAAADDYWSFAVNASGSRQVCYNEMPVGDGGFRSACRVEGSGWTVEYAIPRRAAGLPPLSGAVVCANLFRHRPPQMLGWYLPGFGGYVSMPFGRFRFLRPGEGGETVDAMPEKKPGSAVAQTIAASLEYGPLNHVVVGCITASPRIDPLDAVLSVEGMPVVSNRLVFVRTNDRDGKAAETATAYVACDLPMGDQPVRHATLRVLQNVKEVKRVDRICPAAKMPEWLGTKEGEEYLADRIPAPWTRPTIMGREVHLVDKTIRFAANAMPEAVVRKGALSDTFRAMPTLRMTVGGHAHAPAFRPLTMTPKGNRVWMTTSGRLLDADVAVRVSAILDYDGFLDYTFAVEGADAGRVERLELVLPFHLAAARHFLPGIGVQNAGALADAGWRGKGQPFWIGNEQEGLFFNFDESPFLTQDERHQIAVSAVPDGRTAVLVFADRPGQIDAAGHAFRFFLQPTPTKPYPAKPVRNRYDWWWEGWSGYHGYPDVSKTNWVRNAVAKTEAGGRALTLYCCQGLQENAPEMQAWRDDFQMWPAWRYYKWQGHDCFGTCKRGPEGDFQLARYAQLVRETRLAGLMSDGLSVAWGCANPLHAHGCGRPVTPEVGTETLSRTVVQRNFLKRMRGIFDRAGHPFCFVAHTGGGIDPNTLSFFDAYFEGEQLYRFRRGYYPSRAVFSIGYTGLPWGWRAIYWPKQLHNYNGLDTALSYALLHNSEYYCNPDVEPPFADTDILEPFSTSDTVLHPYWKPQDRVEFSSASALLTLYERTNTALLVVGNLTPASAGYFLDCSGLWPGEKLRCEDLLRKTVLSGTRVEETLPPFSCRVIRAMRGDKCDGEECGGTPLLQEAPCLQVGGDGWRFANAGVGRLTEADGFEITSEIGRGVARAVYAKTFGRNLVVEGSLLLGERFRICLGKQHLTYGGGFPGWGWMFKGKSDPYGRGWIYRTVGLKTGKAVSFRLVLKDGTLDVWYDGQRVVRSLALSLPPADNEFAFETWHTDRIVFRGTGK